MGHRTRFIAALAAGTLLGSMMLAGCGGSDQAESASTTPSPVATVARPAASETPLASQTAVATAPSATPLTEASATPAAIASPPPVAPTVPAPAPTATPPPAPSGVTVVIAAQSARFVPASVAAPLGVRVTVVFNNDDAGVAHDLVLYGPDRVRVGATSVFNGPGMELFSFDTAAAGRYGYACTVHRGMSGALTVE